jgi:Cell wall-associated hydrolases (invasion-associated proteins)
MAGRLLGLFLLLLLFSGCSLHSEPVPGTGSAAGAAISRTALSTIGTRYAYGGASPSSGFDCSGLVCWSYAKNGLKVPRTTREQSRLGTAVSMGQLRPGDLVVFRIKSGLHTGIYTGKGRFVHSPSSGKAVRVDEVGSTYWKGKFIAGRRHAKVY